MTFFELPEDETKRNYAEKLNSLMIDWENEIVEFKEAKSSFNTDKIGKYFSALSNEANLRQVQCGWLVFGVSEDKEKHLVGTHFKEGSKSLLEQFKGEISRSTTGHITFDEIIELSLFCDGKEYRVLMFRIPAAATGIPTEWNGSIYGRAGENLILLQQDKIDRIRFQSQFDWSKQIIPESSISFLDKEAIKLAREKFKERLSGDTAKAEVDNLSDLELLTKEKLIVNGKLTNAALLLLGCPEYDSLFSSAPKVMWRLFGPDDSDKDYEIFDIPFITVIDRILSKVRILTYRYMPNQMSLFPQETQQYDSWLLRELLNNCIAHSDYRIGGRIYLNEMEDRIIITNPGSFLPGSVEEVLKPGYNPPFYRNQLLAESMVKFQMIDTAAMGIRRVFRIQRDRFFPLPDYDLKKYNQVGVTVYGRILNDSYMHVLYDHPELDLRDVFLLDQLQKGHKLSSDSVSYLKKNKLVEGRGRTLYIASGIAKSMDKQAQYIKNRGFDDQYYKDLIVNYLKEYRTAKKDDIRKLLLDKFPEVLSDSQKEHKIQTLLRSLKYEGRIKRDSPNRQTANWILA